MVASCSMPAPSGPASATVSPLRPSTTVAGPAEAADGAGLLVETGGALALVGADGELVSMELPAGPVRWLSAAADRIVVQDVGGAIHTASLNGPGSIDAERLDWEPLAIGAEGLPGPPSFPTVSPAGTRIALVAAEFGSGRPGSVVVSDPDGGLPTVIALGAEANSAAGWLDPGHLLVDVILRGGHSVPAVVDVAAGTVSPIEGLPAAAISEAGRVLVSDDAGWRLRSIDPDPATPTAGALAVPVPEGLSPGQVAVDGAGDRLAVVLDDANGEPVRIEAFGRRGDGWVGLVSLPLTGGEPPPRVAWLE
jgi:hypothetical protein